jgi:hypothetical protein
LKRNRLTKSDLGKLLKFATLWYRLFGSEEAICSQGYEEQKEKKSGREILFERSCGDRRAFKSGSGKARRKSRLIKHLYYKASNLPLMKPNSKV